MSQKQDSKDGYKPERGGGKDSRSDESCKVMGEDSQHLHAGKRWHKQMRKALSPEGEQPVNEYELYKWKQEGRE